MRHSSSFLLVLLPLVVVVSSHGVLSHSLRLELLHRPSATPIVAASRIDHLYVITRSDELPQSVIVAAMVLQWSACEAPAQDPAALAAQGPESAFTMPLSLGAYTGMGKYFVRFRICTPVQRFVLVTNSRSNLT